MLRIRSSERSFQLPLGNYLIGRTLPCHLLVQEPTVSAEHCRIWFSEDSWFIKDLGSTNGTLLDNLPLPKHRQSPLPRSATIKLGNVVLQTSWDNVPDTQENRPFPLVLIDRQEETSTINQRTLYALFSERQTLEAARKETAELNSQSPMIKQIYQEAADLAPSRLPVAIQGETGSGKELLARFIHRQSGRKGPLITLVPTTSEQLQESEFFGYRKGAFTGADRNYPGKIKLAAEGTLFLDELSHIPHTLQVRLLRFLENGEIFPLGAHHSEQVDVRLLVASNIPFMKLVKDGSLREDFYYRLCVHTLTLPPLRERPEDILPLFAHFFGADKAAEPGVLPRFREDFGELLLRYPWPGNIRELKAEAQRLSLREKRSERLVPELLAPAIRQAPPGTAETSPLVDRGRDLREKRIIQDTLDACQGNKSQAAERLQISRRGLYKKMKRLGMDV